MIINPSSILLVAVGGAVGCVARFLVIRQIVFLNTTSFPLGTLVVNILGSLLIGMILGKYGEYHSTRVFFVTGVLGGFTTFSAFSWDMLAMLQRGEWGSTVIYIAASVGLSLAAVTLGFQLVR